jgi:hyperosmotically inducible periplasmic protein
MQLVKIPLLLLNLVLLSLAIGLISPPALALTPDLMDQNGYSRDFMLLDVDSSGKLSSAEIKKDNLFDGGGFAKADKNHSGDLNKDEYATYKSDVQQRKSKQVARDSAITSKIKSKYLFEKNFKSFDVSVETKDGIVMLSGFVHDAATKTRAEQIAHKVRGVKSVKNAILVKP